jgi:hypothetical protein
MINIDIRPSGITSGWVAEPFDLAVAELRENGFDVISGEENTEQRILQGADADVSQNGNYIKEGSLYVKNKGRFFTRKSLVLLNPVDATNAHRNDKEYAVTPRQVEMALGKIGVDSVKVPYNKKPIPTNRFGEDPITVFMFGKQAQLYGDFLGEYFKANEKPQEMGLFLDGKEYVKSQPSDYANQGWVQGLGDDSGLVGSNRDLLYEGRVRGARRGASVEDASGAQNASFYERLARACAEVGISSDLEKRLVSACRRVSG